MIQLNVKTAPIELKVSGTAALIPGPPGKDGETPHIGENGNWYIGQSDTGVPATGPKGDPGATSWNDLTDKPFGDNYTVLYPETTITSEDSDYTELNTNVPLVDGQSYTVVLNGDAYPATVVVDADMNDMFIECVDSDNVEFSFGYNWNQVGSNYVYYAKRGTFTFSILQGEVKPLEEKYIPETIARKADVTWENLPDKPFALAHTTILAETEIAPVFDDNGENADYNGIPLAEQVVEGEAYILIVDEVEYKTVAMMDEMGDVYLGYEGYTTPDTLRINIMCYVETDGIPTVYIRDSQYETHTLAIFKDDKKIDESALPYATEEWTFMLNDGTTVTKQVVVK